MKKRNNLPKPIKARFYKQKFKAKRNQGGAIGATQKLAVRDWNQGLVGADIVPGKKEEARSKNDGRGRVDHQFPTLNQPEGRSERVGKARSAPEVRDYRKRDGRRRGTCEPLNWKLPVL